MTPEKILIIDDTPANIRLLTETLEPLGYEILAASNAEQGLKIATRSLPDLILLDVVMPDRDGYSLCRELQAQETTRSIPVLFVTAKDETRAVLKGFQVGAVDYIPKPFQVEEVAIRVETHLKISRLSRELRERNAQLESEIVRRRTAEAEKHRADERLEILGEQEARRWGLDGFVGRSPLIGEVLANVERLQAFPGTNVLITGESGTGKELIARAVHYSSARAREPFVPVNCVAIPADLAESTFFGHVKGAFTGAVADRKGCFELADGGTLFLDEIGDMPAELQAKLLRVLEDGEVTPVGASRSWRVDVRVVAATNADFDDRIAAGAFRQDLYFRLARYTIEMPSLRERAEDVPLLAAHFLGVFADEMGMPRPELTAPALAQLVGHTFPGNVRELKNIIERALIESRGRAIEPAHLRLPTTSKRAIPPAFSMTSEERPAAPLPLNLEAAEQELIQRALQETSGNVAEAARLLGVNRSRIYRRFQQPAA
jgi:DNA-binding NtrC family response regulator